MNEELQKKLVEILNAAQSAGKEAFLFTKEQVPDILQQLLLWKFWEATIYAILWAIPTTALFSLAIFAIYRFVKDEDEGWLGAAGVVAMIGCVPLIGVVWNVTTMVQIWVAPKVYLLEYAANLIKK